MHNVNGRIERFSLVYHVSVCPKLKPCKRRCINPCRRQRLYTREPENWRIVDRRFLYVCLCRKYLRTHTRYGTGTSNASADSRYCYDSGLLTFESQMCKASDEMWGSRPLRHPTTTVTANLGRDREKWDPVAVDSIKTTNTRARKCLRTNTRSGKTNPLFDHMFLHRIQFILYVRM